MMPATPRRFCASAGAALAMSSVPSTVVVAMPSASSISPAMSKFILSPP